jgi:hypothetical protein
MISDIRAFMTSLPNMISVGCEDTVIGNTTVGSDGSVFIQMGSFSSDGSTKVGTTATGLGAVFNQDEEDRF